MKDIKTDQTVEKHINNAIDMGILIKSDESLISSINAKKSNVELILNPLYT